MSVFIKSIDQERMLKYDIAVVEQSTTIKNLLDSCGKDAVQNEGIQIHFSGKVLKSIFDWCSYHCIEQTQSRFRVWDQAFLRKNKGTILETFKVF
jgi:hypothetical protein